MIYPQYGYTSPSYYPQVQNPYAAPQQPVQQSIQQIRSGGIVSVANETEARHYPVAPGYTVTMRDENGPYLYEKTMGYSQLDQPIFRKARIVFEDDAQSTQEKQEKPEERPDLGTATFIYNYMHPKLQDLDTEEFWLLLMNQNYRLIKDLRIARGGITEVAVDVRLLIKEALLCNATILAVCHNHPSGSLRPSLADNELTKSIQRACTLMRIHFMDHVIITDGHYYSFHEEGKC